MTEHTLGKLIGERLRIVGGHPHSGCTGEIVRIGETTIGFRPIVKLDKPHLGTTECYIVSSKNAKMLPKRKKYETNRKTMQQAL